MNKEEVTDNSKVIVELLEQIEKMKNHANCKHYCVDSGICARCVGLDLWELK